MMTTQKHHKIFIGVTAIVALIVGVFLASSLSVKISSTDLQVINIGLTFTGIILLLIVGSLILDLKDVILAKKGRK